MRKLIFGTMITLVMLSVFVWLSQDSVAYNKAKVLGIQAKDKAIELFAVDTDVANYSVIFNEYRASKGLPPLIFTDELNRLATIRVAQIKTNFSHEGYQTSEILVKDVTSNSWALRTWKDSPKHNAIMLTNFTYTGYAFSGRYAAQVFE